MSEGDEAIVRALHTCDDGRDWSAWYVWDMNSRRRISEGRFELPPERPQIVPPTTEPRKKAVRRKKRKAVESDFH
jgi:hypothetical protein